MMRHRCLVAVVSLALVAHPLEARADHDEASAEALFDESIALMKAGDYVAACPKLAESQRLDPAPGTLVYLGDCLEKTGRVASAWRAFREAVVLAQTAKQPARVELARARAAGLEGKLPKLRFSPGPDERVTALRLDDAPVARSAWSSELPVDPGKHRVEVERAGRTREIAIEIAVGERVVVALPRMEDEAPSVLAAPATPPATPTTHAQPEPNARRTWQRPLALGVGAVGVVGLVVGSVFGLRSFDAWGEAEPLCPDDRCSARGFARSEDARSAAAVSTVAFTAGAVLLVAGAAMYLLAPRRPSSAARGFVMRGSF